MKIGDILHNDKVFIEIVDIEERYDHDGSISIPQTWVRFKILNKRKSFIITNKYDPILKQMLDGHVPIKKTDLYYIGFHDKINKEDIQKKIDEWAMLEVLDK